MLPSIRAQLTAWWALLVTQCLATFHGHGPGAMFHAGGAQDGACPGVEHAHGVGIAVSDKDVAGALRDGHGCGAATHAHGPQEDAATGIEHAHSAVAQVGDEHAVAIWTRFEQLILLDLILVGRFDRFLVAKRHETAACVQPSGW